MVVMVAAYLFEQKKNWPSTLPYINTHLPPLHPYIPFRTFIHYSAKNFTPYFFIHLPLLFGFIAEITSIIFWLIMKKSGAIAASVAAASATAISSVSSAKLNFPCCEVNYEIFFFFFFCASVVSFLFPEFCAVFSLFHCRSASTEFRFWIWFEFGGVFFCPLPICENSISERVFGCDLVYDFGEKSADWRSRVFFTSLSKNFNFLGISHENFTNSVLIFS